MACVTLMNSVYTRRHSTKLVYNLTPAVMQTFKRVLAISTSAHQAESSGPVRYVRKSWRGKTPEKEKKPLDADDDGSQELHRSNPSKSEDSGRSDSLGKGNEIESTAGRDLRYSHSSQGWHDVSRPKKMQLSRTFLEGNDLEQGGRLDPAQNGLDSRMRLFASATIDHEDGLQLGGWGRGSRSDSEEDCYNSAKKYAIGVLSKRLQTEVSLRGKLTRRKVPAQVIDHVIDDLQRCGLQSDMEYAKLYSRSRWTDHTWGPQRIKEELSRKGVSEEKIDAALTDLFQRRADDNEINSSEEEYRWGMTPTAASRLIKQARKQWVRSAPGLDARRNRMIIWLQRRRFPWDTIMDIIKNFESQKNI